MGAPQKRTLTQCESDRNVQQLNTIFTTDISIADSEFSTNCNQVWSMIF